MLNNDWFAFSSMLATVNSSVPFSSSTVPINGAQVFKQWSSKRHQIVSTCLSDLLDTVYPMNVVYHWISMFLRKARMDYSGSCSEGVLGAALQDFQHIVTITYSLQEVSVYDLPETN